MTLTMSVEMPDSFSLELRSLLTGLLQRDVHKRLGCRGRGADEIKSHPFFRGIDWRVVFLQRLPPPLLPARGEVNAADAFDIGSFDDEDTKHIRLSEADQELYRNFPVVVSERWQHEIAETIFDYINHEADKAEMKRKNKHKLGYQEEEQSDCILHGYIKRLGGTFTATWLTRYVRLYPNRLELWSDSGKQPELIFMDQIEEVCNDYVQIKNEQCIVIKLYNHSKYVFTNSDEIGLKEWHVSLKAAHKDSLDMMTTMAEKATKIYGTEIPLKHMGKRRQQLQLEANSATAANSNSAIANLEQKIIQKELQASSRSPEVPATAAAATPASLKQQQHTPMKGLENICPAAARAATRSQVAPPAGQQQAPAPAPQHKYHRGHHQHRTHHHRHHHHAKHGGQVVGGPWPAHHHHRHAGSSRHVPASARGHLPPCQAAAHQQQQQKPPASSEEREKELEASTKNNDSAIFTGCEQTSVTAGALAEKPAQEQTVSAGEPEATPESTKMHETATVGPDDGQSTPAEIDAEPKKQADPESEKKADIQQQSNSIDSSSSGRSGSCSSSSEASAEEVALPEEEQEQEEAGETTQQQAQVSLQVTTASIDQQQQQAAAAASEAPQPEESKPPRPTLSLENVSEHQEVLRDPSKRITSDNKQREQDLVAQYEKLNIGARNSSSSIEEEPQAAAAAAAKFSA